MTILINAYSSRRMVIKQLRKLLSKCVDSSVYHSFTYIRTSIQLFYYCITIYVYCSCKALRRAIDSEQIYFAKRLNKNNKIKTYPSLEIAIQARMRSVASYPGEQSLSYEAAAILVKR